MNRSSNTFINFLVIGYAFVIILVAISASIFFNYEQRISTSFKTYSQNITYQNNIENLFNAATQRSILMVRMINADNAFDVDELNMEMHRHEHIVNQNLLALEDSAMLDHQIELLQQARTVMGKNRTYQALVYELLMDDDKANALKQLVDVTLPTQKHVIGILNALKQGYDIEAKSSQQHYANLIAEMRNMILLVALPIIMSLFVIALLSIRKLKRFANSQQDLLDNLEDIVDHRTQELLLDRNLMQNINEAIGIFGEDDQLSISNKKLSELIHASGGKSYHTIWELLEKLFYNLDIQRIQAKVKTHGSWRGEAGLKSNSSQYYIIDLGMIEDKSLPNSYCSIILTDISEQKSIQNQLEYTANYDAVTQLPNRYYFNRAIQNTIKDSPNHLFHLFYLDLDDFKWVNDHLGHAAGDQFLKEVGATFKSTLPPEHFIARVGGDEFAVILKKDIPQYELGKIANQLLASLKRINRRHSAEHEVGCSIGIASYPEHGISPESLLKCADYAMYNAKDEGRNQFCFFSSQMNEELKYLHEIEQNLRKAVKEKQFEVYYQPQYSLHTMKLVGAEALIRWPTTKRMVPPTEFIPLAEKFGLINDLGEFVFETAARQIKQWSEATTPLPRVAINTSSIQLLAGNFGSFVEKVIQENELSADCIDIEVTESVMMKNIEKNDGSESSSCLSLLQSKGLEISIDDFGTGYSSLSYIKHLNVDRIKIDKSFIDDIEFNKEARSIVKAIIKMGHSLGLKVLAEGIETPNQLDILKALECDEGQGYLFSKPLPTEKFEMKCLS